MKLAYIVEYLLDSLEVKKIPLAYIPSNGRGKNLGN